MHVSLNDVEAAGLAVTSLPHPKEKPGVRAAEVLLNMIDGKKGSIQWSLISA